VQDLKKTTELKSTSKIPAKYLGLMEYSQALSLQQQFHNKVSEFGASVILGVEHPAVLTLGYRAEQEKEVAAISDLPIIKIQRGGLATIHSEGQLVIYPVIQLKAYGLGVRGYVCLLLNTTKQLLNELGIESETFTESTTGLYTKLGKIAFCGIQVKNGISLHGISLNVNNDLNLFTKIIPCGVKQQKMDRIADYGKSTDLEKIFVRWAELFNYNILKQESNSLSCS
jgi:lipoate-protein ligase B